MCTNNDSVYSLITTLCEKYINMQYLHPCSLTLKRARSKCYEILLSKKPSGKSITADLRNISDPMCHLLAWQFQLKTLLQQPKYAEKLRMGTEKLNSLNVFTNETYTNVVIFLLQLREIPSEEDQIMETSLAYNCIEHSLSIIARSKFSYSYFDDSIFKLSEDSKEIFHTNEYLRIQQKNATIIRPQLSNVKYKRTTSSIQKDDIWEIAAERPYNNKHSIWETFDCYAFSKENPFLWEADPKFAASLQLLYSSFENLIDRRVVIKNVVKQQQFIKDLKHLLVGIESSSFKKLDDDEELSLVPNICIEGLSHTVISFYCKDLIFTSSCYLGLNALCTLLPGTLRYKYDGYIFTELCASITRYLSYYRVVVFSLSTSMNLLKFYVQTKQLRAHIRILASICKVGPFQEGEQSHIALGVVLLNNLYEKVLNTTDTNILMVLYSVLHPCCQVYFTRFLSKWILEGTVNDPYGEFFIKINSKYIQTRGRTYWTRSFTLHQDLVPHFIMDLQMDLLFCGKAMNLLKLCVPTLPLCLRFANNNSNLLFCCFVEKQLKALEQNNNKYYLETSTVSFFDILSQSRLNRDLFLSLITQKRSVALSRIELERKKATFERYKEKQEKMEEQRDQLETAFKMQLKKEAADLEEENKVMEKNISAQSLHDKIVKEETFNLIEYYNELFKASDDRRIHLEKITKDLNRVQVEGVKVSSAVSTKSGELFLDKSECPSLEVGGISASTSNNTLDRINANTNKTQNEIEKKNNDNTSIVIETFKEARKNKTKVLALELGLFCTESQPVITNSRPSIDGDRNNLNLTEAQRNKLRVMSSEFDFNSYYKFNESHTINQDTDRQTSLMEVNKHKMMCSNNCFLPYEVDNAKYMSEDRVACEGNDNRSTGEQNKTPDENLNVISETWIEKKKKRNSLSLDFTKIDHSQMNVNAQVENEPKLPTKSPKFELDRISPMSIDSTPLSGITTPLNMLVTNFENNIEDSSTSVTATTVASHHHHQECSFDFETNQKANLNTHTVYVDLSKIQDTTSVSPDHLKRCLTQSITIPLVTQVKLLTSELLMHFVNDLQYMDHLQNLRNYFFLLDGEFGKHVTEGLFKKLYDSNFPIDLVNCRTLQMLVGKALDYSIKLQEKSNYLSFKINNIPKVFNLRNPDVFDCISLTYKIFWPLNILIPSNIIAKYDVVFKFLLKVHRVSWVLQNIFQDLKLLAKQTESSHLKLLLMSKQYQKVQQYRHIMTHFIQTLQNYVVGEVLQSNWKSLERNLELVTSFDQLYTLHKSYIKNILFMCFLSQQSTPAKKALQNIFTVILKFYDYLHSRLWIFMDGHYIHPNFRKLDLIFNNFQQLMEYFFKIGYKIVNSGYQPHLLRLLDMLDVNDYYTKSIAINANTSLDKLSRGSKNFIGSVQKQYDGLLNTQVLHF